MVYVNEFLALITMKKNYFFKRIIFFVCFTFISFSIWATDITVPLGGNIQIAINTVAASGGGTVTLAAGTHNIISPVRMKKQCNASRRR